MFEEGRNETMKFNHNLFLCVRFVAVLLLLSMSLPAFGQHNFVIVRDGYESSSDGDQKPVTIELANPVDLQGIQFTVEYDSQALQIDSVMAVGRLQAIGLQFNESVPGRLTVLAIDFSGAVLPAGDGPIVQIEFAPLLTAPPQPVAVSLADIVLSDMAGQTLATGHAGGYFFIAGASALHVGNGYQRANADTIPVNLVNDFPVSGLELSLLYSPNFLLVENVLATKRSQTVTLEFNTPAPGEVRILLFSPAGDSISAGEGPVLRLIVAAGRDSAESGETATQALRLSEGVVTNPYGEIVQTAVLDGTFLLPFTPRVVSVTGRANPSVPGNFSLSQNYPNPFNPETRIDY